MKLETIKRGKVAEWPLLFKPEMVRATIEGRKTKTRRVATTRNTLFDGGDWAGAAWPRNMAMNDLDWQNAWVDEGPPPAGNPGPYLKAHYPAEGTHHRIYPKYQVGDNIWIRETWRFADWTEDGLPYIEYAADNARHLVRHPSAEWGEKLADIWAELSAPENYNIDMRAADRKWRPSIYMPRDACRLVMEITDIQIERIQDITNDDAIAEGIPVDENNHAIRANDTVNWGSAKGAFAELWDDINAKRGYGWKQNNWVIVITYRRDFGRQVKTGHQCL